MSEDRREYIYRLAMALINGNMAAWELASEQERKDARDYLDRAGILVPEDRSTAKISSAKRRSLRAKNVGRGTSELSRAEA